MSTLLDCPKCQEKVEAFPSQDQFSVGCPHCQKSFTLQLFPACTQDNASTAAATGAGNEVGCLYHPETAAVRICDGCGAFICDLCDLDLGKEHLCPRCLESGRTKGKFETFKNDRLLYDGIALGLALIPLTIFAWFVGFFTAPSAIYLSIKHWQQPGGLIPRKRWRFVVAVLLAVLEIFLFFAICYGIYWNAKHKVKAHG